MIHDLVTRPLCLVESPTLDVAARLEGSLFTSHTFCPNNSSCILRLNENIYKPMKCCYCYPVEKYIESLILVSVIYLVSDLVVEISYRSTTPMSI